MRQLLLWLAVLGSLNSLAQPSSTTDKKYKTDTVLLADTLLNIALMGQGELQYKLKTDEVLLLDAKEINGFPLSKIAIVNPSQLAYTLKEVTELVGQTYQVVEAGAHTIQFIHGPQLQASTIMKRTMQIKVRKLQQVEVIPPLDPVIYDTSFVKKTIQKVSKVDTTFLPMLDTLLRLKSKLNIEAKHRVIIPLPPTDTLTRWAYWLGVGKTAQNNYDTFETDYQANNGIGLLPAYLLNTINRMPSISGDETVDYFFADATNARRFLNQESYTPLSFSKLQSSSTASKKTTYKASSLYLCLANENNVSDIQLSFKSLGLKIGTEYTAVEEIDTIITKKIYAPKVENGQLVVEKDGEKQILSDEAALLKLIKQERGVLLVKDSVLAELDKKIAQLDSAKIAKTFIFDSVLIAIATAKSTIAQKDSLDLYDNVVPKKAPPAPAPKTVSSVEDSLKALISSGEAGIMTKLKAASGSFKQMQKNNNLNKRLLFSIDVLASIDTSVAFTSFDSLPAMAEIAPSLGYRFTKSYSMLLGGSLQAHRTLVDSIGYVYGYAYGVKLINKLQVVKGLYVHGEVQYWWYKPELNSEMTEKFWKFPIGLGTRQRLTPSIDVNLAVLYDLTKNQNYSFPFYLTVGTNYRF
ncbi:MAG: hypothetical protein ACPGXL_07740 [Chitinophagales bacterium]